MIVCIAEKPSVARDIAKVLGANSQHDGYMEGNGYQVTWTYGHLCCLKEPHDYDPMWKAWALSRLPMMPARYETKLIDNAGSKRQFHVIEQLFKHADRIVNCGDAGQEGELIQRWVMQMAGVKCPVDRLWISSLTEDAIREGFNNLRSQEQYRSLYQAAMCRAIGDWLLGMNATRLYTLKYRQGQSRGVLSIGRVQTPTLALIVARQAEIDNFKPQQYWVLSTVYRDTLFNLVSPAPVKPAPESEKADTTLSDDDTASRRGRINSLAEGEQAMAAIKGSLFEITDITRRNGIESPPRLFDLTSLQVECNKHYAFSAEETLRHIQSLYEKKATTYPRVDTTYLSDDIYPRIPKIMQGMQPYAALTAPLLAAKLPKSKKVFDNSKVTDHHAIIPTGVNPAGIAMIREEKLVYDLVARRFIAAFYPDCKFAATTVIGEAAGLAFKATGKQILHEGWRVVMGKPRRDDDDDAKKDDEKTLPQFAKGEKGPHEPTLAEKWTTPPKPYTEATLLRAMETAGKTVASEELREAMKENGIGRPSTRAAIIETLFKRGYVRKDRKNLIATPTGIDLIGVIRQDLLKSAELTGRWEKKLRDIEAQRYSAAAFIAELKQMVAQVVYEVMNDNTGRTVTAFSGAVGKNDTSSVAISPDTATGSAPQKAKKKTKKEAGTTKAATGKKAKKSASQQAVGTPVVGAPCPLCGQGTVLKGKTAYGCSRWREGCAWRHPFE